MDLEEFKDGRHKKIIHIEFFVSVYEDRHTELSPLIFSPLIILCISPK